MLDQIIGGRSMGSLFGIDVALYIVAARYAFTGALMVKDWFRGRKEAKIYGILDQAAKWSYLHNVQEQKKGTGKLTFEEGVHALNAASAKAVQLAGAQGVDLEKEVGDVPAAIQGVVANLKSTFGKHEVEPDA